MQQLLARDLASLLHPQHDPAVHRSGRVWVRGRGAMLVDADGHEYIDGLSCLWNVVLGHGRREVISRELSYHGTTLAAMSAMGISGYWPEFEPRVPGFVHVPPLSPDAGPRAPMGLRAVRMKSRSGS